MVFLYIAAAVCMAMGAAEIVLALYALRRFRKWRGSVLARFADLDAMIAALPSVISKESAERMEKATFGHGLIFNSVEEAIVSLYTGQTIAFDDVLPRRTQEIVKQELKNALEDADASLEEQNAKDKKNGVDITDEVMNLWRYSVADAFNALHKDGGDAE